MQKLTSQDTTQQKQTKQDQDIPVVRMKRKLTTDDMIAYRTSGFHVTFLGMDGPFYKYSMDAFSFFAETSSPRQIQMAQQCIQDNMRIHNIQSTTVIQGRSSDAVPSAPAPPSTSSGSATVTATKIDTTPPKDINTLFEKLEFMCAERKDRAFKVSAFDPLCIVSLLQAAQDPSSKSDEDKLRLSLEANFDRISLRRFLVHLGHAPETLPQTFDDKLDIVVKHLLDK